MPDRNRVEPGDAIGIVVRVPKDRAHVVAALLMPSVAADWILGLPGAITLYATVGRDSVNGRPASHRWVNVITDPPDGVPPEAGIGGLACIGAPSNAVNRSGSATWSTAAGIEAFDVDLGLDLDLGWDYTLG
ncbi:MAG TPA: hypothetical protein VFI15_01625 [Candidatus Limnocylindrales bacterium]|nr:hypothetical protein [Candidatus Limnocylindrales bacterium]